MSRTNKRHSTNSSPEQSLNEQLDRIYAEDPGGNRDDTPLRMAQAVLDTLPDEPKYRSRRDIAKGFLNAAAGDRFRESELGKFMDGLIFKPQAKIRLFTLRILGREVTDPHYDPLLRAYLEDKHGIELSDLSLADLARILGEDWKAQPSLLDKPRPPLATRPVSGSDLFPNFPKLRRKLLCALHEKEIVPIADVIREVYGKNACLSREEALLQLKKDTNKQLAAEEHHYQIRKQGDSLWLDRVSP